MNKGENRCDDCGLFRKWEELITKIRSDGGFPPEAEYYDTCIYCNPDNDKESDNETP